MVDKAVSDWAKSLNQATVVSMLGALAVDGDCLPRQYVAELLNEVARRLDGICSDCHGARAVAASRQCRDCFDGKYVEV